MSRVANRPFFTSDVPILAIAVILAGLLVSHYLVAAIQLLLFR